MSNSDVTIQFLGAAETVTGSKFLVDNGKKKILIDCGLFQGLKKLRLLNWAPLPVNAKEISAVLLTHGHLDHCGYLPRLINSGFTGNIYSTEPSLEIAEIILLDSAKIQEEDAGEANKKGFSKHKPAEPLYSIKDVQKTIKHFRSVDNGDWTEITEGFRARFIRNGHIIGSTYIELETNGKRIVFSGDVGGFNDILMFPPKKPEYADILLLESTYGDRLRPETDIMHKLKSVIKETIRGGGTLLIPSFAVERTQSLMYYLWQLNEKNEIPDVPMIMDSPMGTNVLSVFHKYRDWHKLNIDECTAMCNKFRIVKEMEETYQLIHDPQPKIVVAGSGMLGGGRILHYMKHLLSKKETTILIAGFQAEGTRGRALLNGAREIKFFGEYHPVRARIENLEGISAHADQQELIDWCSDLKKKPEKIFLIHGEPDSMDAFRIKLTDMKKWNVIIPELNSIHPV